MTGGFPIAFTLGALVGLAWAALSVPAVDRRAQTAVTRLDAGLAALVGGLIGARLLYVALHSGYYATNPQQIVWLWDGGLSLSGGVAGALLGVGLVAIRAGVSFWALADALAVPSALLSFAGWVGCLLDGCAYGQRAAYGWLTPASRDLLGQTAPRWPTQSLGALASLGLLALLIVVGPRLERGYAALLSLASIAAFSAALSLVRADPTRMFAGLRGEGLAALAILLSAAFMLVLRRRRPD